MNNYNFSLSTSRNLREFEKVLAERQVEALNGVSEVDTTENGFEAKSGLDLSEEQLRRLTFFEEVEGPDGTIVPTQEYLDRLPKTDENTASLDSLLQQVPNKREHSYLTHDYHSYKGKYYPHLVSSCINAYGDDPDLVLDPFMGSGTTNLESFLHGIDSAGIDLNPIAYLISRTKLQALEADQQALDDELSEFTNLIEHRLNHPKLRKQQRLDNFVDGSGQQLELDIERLTEVLPEYNREYLESWFENDTLKEVCAILDAINDVENETAADILRISLSNIIRKVSLQNESQLRVNRLDSAPRDVDVLNEFLREINKRRKALQNYDQFKDDLGIGGGEYNLVQGDSRELSSELGLSDNSVSYALTSPPYATGLPYIDMWRLSIFLLDLMDKNDRRDFEWKMVGNREINKGQREKLEEEFLNGDNSLPDSVVEIIDEVYQRNLEADVGFRRRNKASLIYKYFRDMNRIFDETLNLLEPGGRFTFVVGNNTTKAGEKQVNIFNDELLLDIAENLGFEFVDRVEMTHQKAHRAHSKNKIEQESIVTVENPN